MFLQWSECFCGGCPLTKSQPRSLGKLILAWSMRIRQLNRSLFARSCFEWSCWRSRGRNLTCPVHFKDHDSILCCLAKPGREVCGGGAHGQQYQHFARRFLSGFDCPRFCDSRLLSSKIPRDDKQGFKTIQVVAVELAHCSWGQQRFIPSSSSVSYSDSAETLPQPAKPPHASPSNQAKYSKRLQSQVNVSASYGRVYFWFLWSSVWFYVQGLAISWRLAESHIQARSTVWQSYACMLMWSWSRESDGTCHFVWLMVCSLFAVHLARLSAENAKAALADAERNSQNVGTANCIANLGCDCAAGWAKSLLWQTMCTKNDKGTLKCGLQDLFHLWHLRFVDLWSKAASASKYIAVFFIVFQFVSWLAIAASVCEQDGMNQSMKELWKNEKMIELSINLPSSHQNRSNQTEIK